MNTPPVAEIRTKSSMFHDWFGGSKLWILTFLCLLLAAGLVWWSTPQRGTVIHIQFPEGHGLQPEDTVRYRGIEVGTVESVTLDDSLEGVEVEVLLEPSATELAVEGTRFWIVRPELSLTRISGLETAIGHKYIGVSPNPMSEDKPAVNMFRFQGLADVPVDTLSDAGIELILRGDKKYSVSKGSAVTFRGVDVGTVLDVELSQDSRHVDVRVRIFDQHASLLTSESKFWASSGLDLDFQFGFNGGFKLDTESLETLARGGVSMITTGQGKAAEPGDVFTLHAAAKDEWFTSAKSYETTDIVLRGAVSVEAKWKNRSVFGTKEKSQSCNGVALKGEDMSFVVVPSDVFEAAEDNDTFELSINSNEAKLTTNREATAITTRVEYDNADDSFRNPLEVAKPDSPIDCIAVRKSDDSRFHISIAADSIKADPEDTKLWNVIDFNGDRKVWHGAPVVSADDGKLIGLLLIQKRKAQIALASEFNLQIP